MPSESEDNVEITWGDEVKIAAEAPKEYRPGEFASVCGIPEESDERRLYLVEFGDGSAIEIPKSLLEKIEMQIDSLPGDVGSL